MDKKTENKALNIQEKDNSFRQTRLRYHMSQKEWAEATHISYGLVKRIETHTISCSPKTRKKVELYIREHPLLPDTAKLNGLEEHILFDIIFSNIKTTLDNVKQIDEQITVSYIFKCVQRLQSLLSNAYECDTLQELMHYFDFLQQLLYAAKSAADENIVPIRNGKFPSDMEKMLKSAFSSIDLPEAKQASKKSGRKDQIEGQSSLF